MKLSALLNGFSILGIGIIAFFAFLAFHSFFPSRPVLDTELVTVNATFLYAKNDKMVGRSAGPTHLIVVLQDDNVQMRSVVAYPSKFKFGLRTPEVIKEGEPVTFILNKSEMERPPKKEMINGQQWREFVGMRTPSAVHLTPEDHAQWRLENQRLGKFLYPALCSMVIVSIIIGYKVTRKSQLKAQQPPTSGSPKSVS
jgi:hypothetical protein